MNLKAEKDKILINNKNQIFLYKMSNEAAIALSDKSLGDWLEHWPEKTTDKGYIVYSDCNLRFTWKKFNERVSHMAKGFIANVVRRGFNVDIWAQKVKGWLTFLYITARIGRSCNSQHKLQS